MFRAINIVKKQGYLKELMIKLEELSECRNTCVSVLLVDEIVLNVLQTRRETLTSRWQSDDCE